MRQLRDWLNINGLRGKSVMPRMVIRRFSCSYVGEADFSDADGPAAQLPLAVRSKYRSHKADLNLTFAIPHRDMCASHIHHNPTSRYVCFSHRPQSDIAICVLLTYTTIPHRDMCASHIDHNPTSRYVCFSHTPQSHIAICVLLT